MLQKHRILLRNINPESKQFHVTARQPSLARFGVIMGFGAIGALYIFRALKVVRKNIKETSDLMTKYTEEEVEKDTQEKAASLGNINRGLTVCAFDFGSVSSKVAIGKPLEKGSLIDFHDGRHFLPQFLARKDGQIVAGQVSKGFRFTDPSNCVHNVLPLSLGMIQHISTFFNVTLHL